MREFNPTRFNAEERADLMIESGKQPQVFSASSTDSSLRATIAEPG